MAASSNPEGIIYKTRWVPDTDHLFCPFCGHHHHPVIKRYIENGRSRFARVSPQECPECHLNMVFQDPFEANEHGYGFKWSIDTEDFRNCFNETMKDFNWRMTCELMERQGVTTETQSRKLAEVVRRMGA